MSRRRFSATSVLIADLLDRHERTPNAVSLVAPIDNDGFTSVDLRDAFDEELASLEREGGVELIRSGRRSERVVTGVRLKDADVLYRHIARRPSDQIAEESLSGLRDGPDLPEGSIRLVDEVAQAWGRGVSFMGIQKGDVRTLKQVIGLAMGVQARLKDNVYGEIDFRTFSRLSVADSKALEKNVRLIVPVITRIFGATDDQARLDPEEFLASAGITRIPQPVLIRGAIALDGKLFPDMPFVGIPTECVERVDLIQKPDYVLTIENFTSFVRYVREVASSDRGLVIYSGGFPSRPTLTTIGRLVSQAQMPTFHWGDMDVGGVRIFRYIERSLSALGFQLLPHMMDVHLLRRTGIPGTTAPRLIGDMAGSAIAELASLVEATGLVHEQEEFSPRCPLDN